MGRKMYVYTKKEGVTDFIKQMLTDYWYDITHKIFATKDDIYTTNIYALYGAQDNFDEVFVDGKQLWPDDKKDKCWGDKELRYGHNLCRLIGAWTAHPNETEEIIEANSVTIPIDKDLSNDILSIDTNH